MVLLVRAPHCNSVTRTNRGEWNWAESNRRPNWIVVLADEAPDMT